MFGLPTAFGYSNSESALATMWTEERRAEFGARQETARIIRTVEENKYGSYVVDFLARKFHRSIFVKLALDGGINTEDNVLRDLADRICVGFSRGVKSRLWGPDNQIVESPEFAAFTGPKVLNLSAVGAALERKTKMYGPCWLAPWIAYSERLGERRMGVRIHTPETYDLIGDPSNPYDYIGVILFDDIMVRKSWGTGEQKRMRATIWTREKWWQYVEDERGGFNAVGGNIAGNDNPYKTIPGIRASDSDELECMWPYADGSRWAEATVRTAAWETYKDHLGASQVKSLIGEFDDTFPAGQVVRQAGAVALGKTQNVQMIDWQTNLKEFDDAMIQTRKARQAGAAHLPMDEFAQTIVPESGTARRLRNADRDADVVRRQGPLKRALEEMYALAWWMAYVEMGRAGAPPIRGLTALPPGAPPFAGFDPVPNGRAFTATVDPEDINYAETETERQQRLTFNVAQGYQDRVEEMRRINPNLSEDEADALIIARLAKEAVLQNKAAVRMAAMRQDAEAKGQALPSTGDVLKLLPGTGSAQS